MKKVLIIHGWDGNPEEPLHQYLKKTLEELGYEVTVPLMPDPERPIIKDWIEKIEEVLDDSYEIVIGHSIGCQAALRFLESLESDLIIPNVILIAPWMKLDQQTIEEEGEEVVEIAKPWMETPIDFEKVLKRISKVTAIFSDNDPYVPLDQSHFFHDNLNAEIIIEKNQGHFTETDNFIKLQTNLEEIS